MGKRDSSKFVDKSFPPAGRAVPRPRLAGLGPGAQVSAALSVDADIDDGNTWLDEAHQLDPQAVGAERHTFTLGGRTDIDLSSPYLRDILSDTDVYQVPTHDSPGTSEHNSTASRSGPATGKPLPASTDWESRG